MTQAARPERLDWVDTARGIGILLVVYGHALRGHVTSGQFDPSWHADLQDSVIYAFHMPLFFFLAGLFAKRSLTKGAQIFVREKAVTLVYPYFLWSIVSVGLGSLAAGAVNSAVDGGMLLVLWRTPVYQYWFLYALVICQLVTLITRGNPWITGLLCVISAFDVRFSGFNMLTVFVSFYIYFGAGILIAPYLSEIHDKRRAIAAAATLAAILFLASFFISDIFHERFLVLGRAVTGIVATVGVAMLCAPWSRWLAVLGAASMAIYVLHTIFSAGLRIGLRTSGYSNDLVALILGALIGIFGPLAIWALARRYGALPWLGLGAQPRIPREQVA